MRGNSLGGYSNFCVDGDEQTAIKCSDVLVLSDKRANLAAAPVGRATPIVRAPPSDQSLHFIVWLFGPSSKLFLSRSFCPVRDYTALTGFVKTMNPSRLFPHPNMQYSSTIDPTLYVICVWNSALSTQRPH
jgi:hypothetical protein